MIVETLYASNGVIASKYDNMGKADVFSFNFNFSTSLFNYIDFDLYFLTSYTNFKNRESYNGFSYDAEIELSMPLFWDIDLDASVIILSKNISYNGYEKENFMIDEIAISKYILNDYFIIGFSVWEPFFKSISQEIRKINTYIENTTSHVVNSTCYMFNLIFIFDKGKKSKKIKSELLMEDNKKGK